MEFVHLHVISKNLQSIKSTDRFQDFLAEVDRYQFHLLLVSERGEVNMKKLFLLRMATGFS